jgi:hypothetical protein
VQTDEPVSVADEQDELPDEESRAEQILKELDAYVAEQEPLQATRRSDPSDDALVIIGVLVVAGAIGALTGWFVAPSLIHDLFEAQLGIEADGPDSFRRLGAFLGTLVSMLFGAILATMMRR